MKTSSIVTPITGLLPNPDRWSAWGGTREREEQPGDKRVVRFDLRCVLTPNAHAAKNLFQTTLSFQDIIQKTKRYSTEWQHLYVVYTPLEQRTTPARPAQGTKQNKKNARQHHHMGKTAAPPAGQKNTNGRGKTHDRGKATRPSSYVPRQADADRHDAKRRDNVVDAHARAGVGPREALQNGHARVVRRLADEELEHRARRVNGDEGDIVQQGQVGLRTRRGTKRAQKKNAKAASDKKRRHSTHTAGQYSLRTPWRGDDR